ncbi:transglycosylase SLT domain-containing protein [Caballeronia sp. ATUFL_M1_KS5A]|uniref:transglycosylase SLT domain-containing protein n=1 Tax=Caballeronia sp. ATUFL_M1_KS5A TaxID=2921778 RepID=UPI0020278329|nr:transglycosylase SLT domain-containing protein [Caballeronia sp. ATUFL_M1_KS5A]
MTNLAIPTPSTSGAISRDDAFQIASNTEQKYGLPEGTLWKMSGIEDGSLNPHAVSPVGAKGFFQFTDATAKAYGLDDPSDYGKSADAAARYMTDNLKRYGGNMSLALADYNGGPKAVKALAAGKPWPETSDYLAKFFGGKPEPLSSAFTTGDSITPDSSVGASALHEQAAKRARDGGFLNGLANLPSAVSLGFQQDNSVYNWWQERGIEQTDPNWSWNDENSKQYLEGVPEKHWDYILQAKSQGEADFRRSRMQQSMENEQKLADMGVAGMTGRIAGGLADLPTLIAFVPGMGGEGLLTTTSRIANAVRMGMVGAASNVAYDAVANQYKPMATTDDLYISAAMGLGLGALGGAAVNPAKVGAMRLAEENARLAKYGQKAAAEAQKSELIDKGFDWSAGRQEFQRTIDAMLNKEHVPANPLRSPEEYARIDAAVAERKAAEAGGSVGEVTKPKAPLEPEVQAVRGETEAVPTFTMRGSRVGSEPHNVKSTVSAKEYLQGLVESSKDPLQATLASRLLANLKDDLPIHTVNKSQLGKNVRGSYDPQSHSISVHRATSDDTKLHEVAHAATVHKVMYGRANPESAHGQLVKQLQEVYDSVKANMKANGVDKFSDGSHYYMSNLDEFIAGLYTGKTEFRDYLAKAKVDSSSDTALSKIMDIFRKLLGMDSGETNALVKSLGLADQLKDTPLNVSLKKSTPGVLNMNDPWPQGSMSVRTDAPHLEAAHPTVDAATVDAANAAKIPTVFGWGLGLESKLGGAKAPQEVRDLASKLFGSTIGYKDHSVVKANAWDDTLKWAEGWATEMRKNAYPSFEKWFKDQKLPFHKKGEAYENFGSQVSDYIRGIQGEYAPEVMKAGDAIRKTLAKVVDYVNNPLKDEGGVKLGLTQQELRHPETGEVTVVGGLEKNENYLPRKHDVNKWNSMVTAYGHEAVQGWWARAFQKGRPNISDEAAAKWAKWYVRTVEESHANRTQDLLTGMLQGQDKDALLHSLMVNGNYSHYDAEKMIEDMFPTKASDAGRVNSSLKHRNTIDETHSEQWTMKDGSKQEVSLNDFIHTNAFDVVEPYLRRTAGNVALAKHLDIYKNSVSGQ